MSLNGIDIASWQAGIDISRLATTQFVIVKATGGSGYTNDYYREWAEQVLNSKKLLGFYHFAQDSCGGTAKAEADHFVSKVKEYVGRASLYLDWEANALPLGPKWAKAWLDRVYAKTGVKPGIYMSKGVCRQYDWSPVIDAGYPLWVAQYPDYSPTGYRKPSDIWTDSGSFGGWASPTIFQYTSSGRIEGYGASLDLDCFYGDSAAWDAMSAKGGAVARAVAKAKSAASNSGVALKVAVSCAEVAAKIHQRMCDDDGFGYSWEERYGTDTDRVTWVIEGRSYTLSRGDYDCSSSVITAWKMALQGTAYEGVLDGATYTGNMRRVFAASGLFEVWDTATTYAVRGDVYLNDTNHTAMCQDGGTGDGPYGADMLSEFCINEKGGTHGGRRGDQTGYEAYVHGFYEYSPGGWDCTLHYNHKADTTAKASSPTQVTAGGETAAKLNVDGDWGPLTTKEFKRQLGIKVNGKRDGALYKALRKRIGPAPKTEENWLKFTTPLKKRLQKKLGVEQDGIVGPKTVKALQKALNKGKVATW